MTAVCLVWWSLPQCGRERWSKRSRATARSESVLEKQFRAGTGWMPDPGLLVCTLHRHRCSAAPTSILIRRLPASHGPFSADDTARRLAADAPPVQPLFSALSSCSALHASLLPSGEPSSFGFFPSNDDIDDGEAEWSDADEEDDGAQDGEGEGEGGEEGGAGRVRSDFHSGGGPGARFRPY